MAGLYVGQRRKEKVEFQFQTLLEGVAEVLLHAEYFTNQTKLTFICELRPYMSEILQGKLTELERIFDAKIALQTK